MKITYLLSVLFLLSLAACSSDGSKNSPFKKPSPNDLSQFEAKPEMIDTSLVVKYDGYDYDVDIKAPDGSSRGTILVLQGWNFPNTDWCDSTSFCTRALEEGYVLVFPEMGKSIYSENTYAETRSDWLKYPTRKWLRDSVIGKLQQEFGLFDKSDRNFVLGLSTGGRGALLLAIDLPQEFSGCATLSGDYDQSMFPNDNLYVGFFGKMNSFKDRWKKEENPINLMLRKDLRVPVYIGHGMADNVVPYFHFELLKEFLDNIKPEVEIVYHTDSTANHNYTYWNSEVENVLEFFETASN